MAANRLFSFPSFRFSIRQLLLGTALVAVGCVALRSASPTWVAALLGLMLLVLTAAVPLAIFRQGADRAWWFGFALFGWLYILLLAYSWGLDPNTSQSNPFRPYSLVTAQLSSSGYMRMYAANDSVNSITYYQPAAGPTGPVSIAYPVTVTAQIPTSPYSTGGPPPPIFPSTGPPTTFFFGTNVATSTFNGPSHDDFINVAHAFWAFLLALCGGWFTCWVYSTRRAPSQSSDHPPDSTIRAPLQ
jgi:hypothetical protein